MPTHLLVHWLYIQLYQLFEYPPIHMVLAVPHTIAGTDTFS